MISSRLIGLFALSLSFAILAGCNKEPPKPVTPSTPLPESSPAPAPAPATPPAPSTAPSPSAPATGSAAPAGESSSGAASRGGGQDELALANKSGCLACHSVDKQIVGPAWKDVAAKYRGQPDAETKLVQKVKNGGAGTWGQVPMPPNTQVKDDDIKKLVDWILKLK